MEYMRYGYGTWMESGDVRCVDITHET